MRGLFRPLLAHVLVCLLLAASVIHARLATAPDALPREVRGTYTTLVENQSYFVGISRAGPFRVNITNSSNSWFIDLNPQSITVQWLGATGTTTFNFPEVGAFLLADSAALDCGRSVQRDLTVQGQTAFVVHMLELVTQDKACRVHVAGEVDVKVYDYLLHLASTERDVAVSGAGSHAFVLVLTPRGGSSSVTLTLTPEAKGFADAWLVGVAVVGIAVVAAIVLRRRRTQ